MSNKELDQAGIFEQLQQKNISQIEAAKSLRLTTRQVRRKYKLFLSSGASSLAHRARGKPGNRMVNQAFKQQALDLILKKYTDFGPTLAAEKLKELDGITVNPESLRLWMSVAKLWEVKNRKQSPLHPWRERRACLGELVQLDGSHHDWFEGRAPKCCLLAFIDDATSQILWMEFAESESTQSLMRATTHYLEHLGKPVELYADRGSVYKVHLHNEENEKKTQFGRALDELGIGLIFARSPQAKGRVERLFGTLQDRLVKELRLRNICDMETANQFLKDYYTQDHNNRFAVAPMSATNLHTTVAHYDLQSILCLKESRVLQSDWCIAYKTRWLQLDKTQPVLLLKKTDIQVFEYQDGSIHLQCKNKELRFRELPERPQLKPQQKKGYNARIPVKPAANHPWRNFSITTHKADISKLEKADISILV